MSGLRYKYMAKVKELKIKLKKKLTAHSRIELEELLIKYNIQKRAANKIGIFYKKYKTEIINKKIQHKNELTNIRNKIKQLEIENFKYKKQIDDLKYSNKCKQQEIARLSKKNNDKIPVRGLRHEPRKTDMSEKIKREIEYDKIPEMSIYQMKKYLQDKNIEVDKNCSTHEMKQIINRFNNDKYRRLFSIKCIV